MSVAHFVDFKRTGRGGIVVHRREVRGKAKLTIMEGESVFLPPCYNAPMREAGRELTAMLGSAQKHQRMRLTKKDL